MECLHIFLNALCKDIVTDNLGLITGADAITISGLLV